MMSRHCVLLTQTVPQLLKGFVPESCMLLELYYFSIATPLVPSSPQFQNLGQYFISKMNYPTTNSPKKRLSGLLLVCQCVSAYMYVCVISSIDF